MTSPKDKLAFRHQVSLRRAAMPGWHPGPQASFSDISKGGTPAPTNNPPPLPMGISSCDTQAPTQGSSTGVHANGSLVWAPLVLRSQHEVDEFLGNQQAEQNALLYKDTFEYNGRVLCSYFFFFYCIFYVFHNKRVNNIPMPRYICSLPITTVSSCLWSCG